MSVDNECGELDIKLSSVSPTVQSDTSTDGDASTTQTTSNSNDKSTSISLENLVSCEPKAKKRRKQSNPLKIQNAPSPKFDLSTYDVADQAETASNQNLSYDFEEDILTQNQDSLSDKSKGIELTSQKGTLSRVTNALLKNKVKEAAKISSKSKESSLQSLTDISSPESGEDVVSNEYKNNLQNVYSNIPSILPINPIDVANDASKLSNIYNFSDFSSPIQQGNVNLSVSQRSFVTSSGVRVFNPEAYCELCEKEFCNKYFLKTHKANKHGICSSENSPGGGYGGYRVSYKNMHLNPQAAQQMISQMCETGATFGSADSYCNICQKYFCNKYFLKKHRQNIHGIYDEMSSNIPSSIHVPVISSPLPLIRQVSHESKSIENSAGNVTKDEDSLNVSIENIKNSLNCNLPLLNGSSPNLTQNKSPNNNQKEKKSEKFLCELCNIEFCEKCYLDAHMLNKHGSMKVFGKEFPDFSEVGKVETSDKGVISEDMSESKEFKGQMCTPCMKNFTSAESFQNHMLEIHGASLKEEEDSSKDTSKKKDQNFENGQLTSFEKAALQEMDNSNNSNDSVTYNCNLCFQKYKDTKSFLSHAESEHGIVGNAALEASNLPCDACAEQFSDRIALMSHKFKVHGIIPSGFETQVDHGENGEYVYYQGLRQKSSGSSFCQICNKELCNKYFMKTHMLKMHGIDVDKAQIERWSASSTGGVYCDICQKFLCSKYFLKVHKQNVHGIADDSVKLGAIGESPSYSNNLSLNDKKGEKFSPNSSLNSKINSNKESLSVNDDLSKRSNGNMFACEICGQVFHDKLTLQIHQVNKHVKCNDSKVFPNSNSLSDDSKDALKAGILPCPCCSFINLDDNSKLTQINGIENKIISCLVCNVTYHLSDYHTHHLSHGTSLPTGRNNYENGSVNEMGNGFNFSEHSEEDPNKHGMRPKLKRFRCSKCDKTFRTKMKCLHHIQVMHKIKKSLSNQCDSQNPSKKISLNASYKKSDIKTSGPENGTSSLCTKESDDRAALLSSCLPEGAPLPVPYILPKNSDVIMQPFHLTEPKPDEATKQSIFVPSVVYLPVSQKVSEKLTVAFTLTPA